MSDGNAGDGLDGWFVPEQNAADSGGQVPAAQHEAQPTQRIMEQPADAADAAATQVQAAVPQQHQQQPLQAQQPQQPQSGAAAETAVQAGYWQHDAQGAEQQQPQQQYGAQQGGQPGQSGQPPMYGAQGGQGGQPAQPLQQPYGGAQSAPQQPAQHQQPTYGAQPIQDAQPFGSAYPSFGAQNAQPTYGAQPTVQPFGPDSGLGDGADGHNEARPRRTKLALATGIGVAGVIGLATVLMVTQTGGTAAAAHTSAAATKPKPTPSGFQPTGKTVAADAQQTAAAFLTAWQSGDVTKAASYTDDPTDAANVLSAYRTGLSLTGLQLAPGTATAAGVVGFSLSASVSSTGVVNADGTVTPNSGSGSTASSGATASASGTAGTPAAATSSSASGTWGYNSQLTAYKKNGGWWIKWDPTLVAPSVTDSVHPVALAVAPGAGRVTDASGGDLSGSSEVALQNIAANLKKTAKTDQGTAGLEIALEDSSGKIVSGSANELSKPVSTAVVKTTIDPSIQALANTAVTQFPRSSMVVIRPSTGAILAVANSAGIGDTAMTGTLAPGSSMKVITTTGLLTDGMLPQGINTPVGCPLVDDVQGVQIHNSTDSKNSLSGTEDFEPPSTPFSTDFAQSCNNAFTQWWQQMAGGKLADAASNYFGLNQAWDLGLGSKGTYFSMPSHQSGSELAEELYGQGEIEANPLSMASVAATVDTGQFHQPYLVDGLTDKVSATALPSSVQSQLYSVMREVVTSGTAVAVGFGSGVYGKTGTAEADANKDKNPNGWMIVFDPSKDLAIAAVVVDNDFGAKTAGPETNYVLQHS